MYNEYLLQVETIWKKLMDQQSKEIMNARIDYMLDRDRNRLANICSGGEVMADEMNEALPNPEKKKIIIFGCDRYGHINKRALEKCGYHVYGFCDNYYTGIFEGLEVLSTKEAVLIEDAFFVISSIGHRWEIYEQLAQMRVRRENIFVPLRYDGIVAGFDSNQYFDVWTPSENEIFLDAGGFDGMTTKKFKDWAGEDAMSYILEASEVCYTEIERKIKNGEFGEKVSLIKGAAWSENEDLFFLEAGSAGRIDKSGEKVKGVKIDDVVPEATFIKMDIEGAEVQAIRGAEKLIKKCKPRMAISIYHKPTDIIAVPAEILKINPEYKFIIRHYSTDIWETVLYAYI